MELLVYKASAGSGKTFTLAVEYIKHLIINPRAYRQILAVTFTNKATAEMKERILTQLYGIRKGAPSTEANLEKIKKYKLKADSKDMAAMLSFAEVYNGFGYFNKGVVSPYIYSGTNLYKKGKFVSDGSYNASVTDKQPGVFILIKKII